MARYVSSYEQERAREELKSMLGEYLLKEHGDSIKDIRRPFCCLVHSDRNPSMSYDKHRQKVHCFSCGVDMDIIDLIAHDRGCTTGEAFEYGYKLFGIDSGRDFSLKAESASESERAAAKRRASYIKDCETRISETDYATRVRGLSPSTILRFHLGYDPHFSEGTGGKEWRALIIPTGKASYIARNTDTAASGNNRSRNSRGPAAIINVEALERTDTPVFVTEGQLDALSIIDAGGEAIGIGGVSHINALMRYISEHGIKRTAPLLIAFDNDTAGQEATGKLIAKLRESRIDFEVVDIYGEAKDANEALVNNREGFVAAVKAAIRDAAASIEREFESITSLSRLAGVKARIAERHEAKSISTGFPRLDAVLNGGLTPALYVIGAVSSLGKTAFALQIADQIAMQGKPILYFSLEMSADELIARSLSRETFQLCGGDSKRIRNEALTTSSILNGDIYSPHERARFEYTAAQTDALKNAENLYREYANKIYIKEGVSDFGLAEIRDTIDRYTKIKKESPVVVVDYLQLLTADTDTDKDKNDKQRIDLAIVDLKRISRDYMTPVIVISSFNRGSYKSGAQSESFKESGAIEYSADVLIGLHYKGVTEATKDKPFNFDAARRKSPREVECVILKNRNGNAGEVIQLDFMAMYNTYDESSTRGETDEDRRRRKRNEAKKLSYAEQIALETWRQAAIEHGVLNPDGTVKGVHIDDWRLYYLHKSTADTDSAKNREFARIRAALAERGLLTVDADIYDIVNAAKEENGDEY